MALMTGYRDKRALRLCSTALAGGVALWSTGVHAQAPAADGSAQAGAALPEVVVTAERRTENSQRVPVAIQTIDAKAIAAAGYTSVTDLQFLAPGVQYDPTQGSAFQIRGVGSESFDFSNAKSVNVVVDDVVMDGQRANGLIGLVDLSHVDVLMGPQGTLFGKNSTSGVIAVTTGAPQLGVTSLRASASYGEHDDRILNATANVPLGQSAALRLSAFDQAQDGFGRNVTLNKDVGATDDTASAASSTSSRRTASTSPWRATTRTTGTAASARRCRGRRPTSRPG